MGAELEADWCKEQRSQVVKYLDGQGVEHGGVGEWPAWHVAPYVSLWAVESVRAPGQVGWWVISGDLPTDYISSKDAKSPREAVGAIAVRWRGCAKYMERGESHPTIHIGYSESFHTLAPMLEARATLLERWASDDQLWGG